MDRYSTPIQNVSKKRAEYPSAIDFAPKKAKHLKEAATNSLPYPGIVSLFMLSYPQKSNKFPITSWPFLIIGGTQYILMIFTIRYGNENCCANLLWIGLRRLNIEKK